MIVQIKVRGEDGKYTDAPLGQFAEAAFRHIVLSSSWRFLRIWLERFCLVMAAQGCEAHGDADAWIRRYQAIRGIE